VSAGCDSESPDALPWRADIQEALLGRRVDVLRVVPQMSAAPRGHNAVHNKMRRGCTHLLVERNHFADERACDDGSLSGTVW
jgi:hypothetical protein